MGPRLTGERAGSVGRGPTPPLRLLLWYWGRRGAGAQITHALACSFRRLPGIEIALSVSAQSVLHAETAALGLPMDSVSTYGGAAGFLAGLPRVPLLARRLRRQAEAFGADVVLSVMTHLWTPLVAPHLARCGLRYVAFVHDAVPHAGDPPWLWGWRLQRELDAAAAAFVFSGDVEAALRRRHPTLALHRLVLPAPIGGGVAAAAGAPRGHPQFVHLGRLLPYKGLDLLRDAWTLLRHAHPTATLLVAGEGDIAALAPGLADLPGVTLRPGWLQEAELVRLIAAADALVLPYREASQSGLVPIAHALGVPAVATPVGGLPEQIRHGIDGVLTAAATPQDLAAAMALLCDPALQAHLAAGAQARGRDLADWDDAAARMIAVLDPSCGRVAAPRAPAITAGA